ncbi:MAG: ABC transporter ATP-binding protein [Anaerolineae bacterium]|nr:ABC transporter ATP-binding protein [Anaerolineae bacterium]
MLQAQNIIKSFNHIPVLKGVSLDITAGEIICLLGPSGCGKTTLLRIIAGLETAESGVVLLNGETITRVPVHQRDFGLMFQDFALFPHMSVEKNVAFGLEMQRKSPSEIQKRVDEVLELVGLAHFKKRPVTELSGGEQQRVALARSLAPNPRVLMLDEPLGSLDAALRERLAVDLRDILKAAGVTAIYVTHDQQEAFAIADRIAVMNAGRIEQIAPPETLYLCPQTVFVARFLGLENILPVNATTPIKNGYTAHTVLGDFPVEHPAQSILLHPAYAELMPDNSEGAIPVTLVKKVFQGSQYELTLSHESGVLLTVQEKTCSLQVHQQIYLQWKPKGIISLEE